jgi:hypothetical protein
MNPHLENKKCVGGYRKGEMNGHVIDSEQMTCSSINELTKGYQFTFLARGFCGFPQPEYVEFKTVTVSKSIHPSEGATATQNWD